MQGILYFDKFNIDSDTCSIIKFKLSNCAVYAKNALLNVVLATGFHFSATFSDTNISPVITEVLNGINRSPK